MIEIQTDDQSKQLTSNRDSNYTCFSTTNLNFQGLEHSFLSPKKRELSSMGFRRSASSQSSTSFHRVA